MSATTTLTREDSCDTCIQFRLSVLPAAHGLSRRQFLCTTAAGVAAAPALAASVIGAAQAAGARPAQPAGRSCSRAACVLSLDRAVGDFEQADVLIEGKKI